MTFGTKIQTYDGAHANHNIALLTCAVDWAGKRLWMGSTVTAVDYLSRYGTLSGLEEAFATIASINAGAVIQAVGWDAQGSVYMSGPNDFTHGAITEINQSSLSFVSSVGYSAPNFGGTNIVRSGSSRTMADTNVGNNIINLNNTSYSHQGVYESTLGWPNSNSRSAICSGAEGSSKSFIITSPGDGIHTQISTLRSVDSFGAATTVGTYVPTDIDASWTFAAYTSMCMDQSDGNPICNCIGVGGANQNYIVKFNGVTGTIVWKTLLTTTTNENIGGGQWSQSRIRHQKLAFLQRTPGYRIIIIDTSDGSIVSTQTDGLVGITIYGQQCFDDSSGAVIGMFGWDGTPGPTGPEPLNGSVAATGWAAIYVTSAIVDVAARRFQGFIGLSRVQSSGVTVNDRITEAGDLRVTEAGDQRILQ